MAIGWWSAGAQEEDPLGIASANTPSMQLMLKMPDGKIRVIALRVTATVRDIESFLLRRYGLQPRDIRLISGEKQLADGPLQAQGVTHGSVIKVLIRLRGGGRNDGVAQLEDRERDSEVPHANHR